MQTESLITGNPADGSKIDVLKFRLDSLWARFFSYRDLEWTTTWQLYAGFGAIGVAFAQIRPQPPRGCLTGGTILLTVCLWGGYLYLSWRIQERMRYVKAAIEKYEAELHEVAGVQRFEKTLGFEEPKHPHDWAFSVQIVLSSLVAVLLIFFVLQ
jgi:hypothetical protein